MKKICVYILVACMMGLMGATIAFAQSKPTVEDLFPQPSKTSVDESKAAEKRIGDAVGKKVEESIKKDMGSIMSGQPTVPSSQPASSQTPEEKAQEKKDVETLGSTYASRNVYEMVGQLPKGSIESIIAGVIKIILGVGGFLAALSLLVSGVMYVVAQDNEDMSGKAKKIIIYSLIGLIVISVSFAIFTGLATIVAQ